MTNPKYSTIFLWNSGLLILVAFAIDILHYIATIASQCILCALDRYPVENSMN